MCIENWPTEMRTTTKNLRDSAVAETTWQHLTDKSPSVCGQYSPCSLAGSALCSFHECSSTQNSKWWSVIWWLEPNFSPFSHQFYFFRFEAIAFKSLWKSDLEVMHLWPYLVVCLSYQDHSDFLKVEDWHKY